MTLVIGAIPFQTKRYASFIVTKIKMLSNY